MRVGLGVALSAALLLVGGGCARSRPCVVIPMQLRLAQQTADSYQAQVTAKQAEIDRAVSGLGMAEERLKQLEAEEAELLSGSRPDTTGGKP